MLKRLLFVTPFALLPAAEGHRKRMMMTLGQARRHGYQVDILFIAKEYGWSERFNRKAFREMQALADNFFHVHQPTPADPAGHVYGIDEWWSEELDRYCEWLFANNGYEAVFCNYVFLSRVFDSIRYRTRRLLETHDVFTGRKEMLLRNGLRPEFFYTSRAEERKGIKRADTVIAIKDEEADFFRRLTPAEVVTLPFVEPTVRVRERRKRPADGPLVFGFFGSANSLNVQAVQAFVEFLAASGEQAAGLWEVHLYGTVCNRLSGGLPASVKSMGLLDEPGDFYAAVDCVVNFQQVSTGLKIKIAEALAYGVPLISLAHAFEGFGRPAHPAQACAGLPDLLAEMRAAATDPAHLADIAAASVTVERALVLRTERVAARLFGTAETDPAMLFVVDGALYARSVVYRHVVNAFRLAFVRSWAACLFLEAGVEPDGEFRAFADGFGRVADQHDLAALAPTSVLLLFAADLIPAHLVGRFARVVLVEVACDQERPGAAAHLRAATTGGLLTIRGRGGDQSRIDRGDPARPVLFLSLFRWMPWDLALAQRPQHFSRDEGVWVLRSTAPDKRADALLCAVAGTRPIRFWDAQASGTVHQLLFEERVVPAAVFVLGDGAAFAPLLEWLTVTGVEVRRFPLADGGVAPAPPRFLLPASALVAHVVPREPEPPKPLSDWHASGWSDLADWVGLPGELHSPSASSPASLGGADRVAP